MSNEPNKYDTTEFYDAVVDDYHLWYRDWESTLDREGLQLRRWLRDRGVNRILDASCGPGTQSVALAQLGYSVVAADPSEGMLMKAESNAQRHNCGENIRFLQSDFAALPKTLNGEDDFDALLTKGNAFPHLISDAAIEEALNNFHRLLRPGGTAIIGLQDFEPFIEGRPRFIPGRVHDPEVDNEPQIITFDIWDWDDGPPLTVTVNSFIVSGRDQDYRTVRRPVVYRALTAAEVQVGLLEAGFEDIQIIRDRLEVVLIATKPE
jgi:glycine/sarcosine N-methyltransferase